MNPTKFQITITTQSVEHPVRRLIAVCEIVHNDFDAHDTAGMLFALEFAANNHSEVPMRVHIMEKVD